MENIIAALNAAQYHATRRAAEDYLRDAAIQVPLYYAYLLQIATDANNVPEESKILAAIQFKNGVDRYWRKSAKQ